MTSRPVTAKCSCGQGLGADPVVTGDEFDAVAVLGGGDEVGHLDAHCAADPIGDGQRKVLRLGRADQVRQRRNGFDRGLADLAGGRRRAGGHASSRGGVGQPHAREGEGQQIAQPGQPRQIGGAVAERQLQGYAGEEQQNGKQRQAPSGWPAEHRQPEAEEEEQPAGQVPNEGKQIAVVRTARGIQKEVARRHDGHEEHQPDPYGRQGVSGFMLPREKEEPNQAGD
jgi:hypothetical protein